MKQYNKILITGGSGLLALNWALAARGRYPVVLGLHHREVSLEGVEARFVDIDSPDLFAAQLEDVRPRVVIHTAGLTSVEECEAKPETEHHISKNLVKDALNMSSSYLKS